ncbi:unnamed protein product [Lampetra planeri]
MAKTVTSSNTIAGKMYQKMAPPVVTLLPEKKIPTNGHSSPARTGKTPPSNTEKKPLINGYASPSHLAANSKQIVEGYMKTDDRMRLAKERREERERSLAAREQLIREKERRARLQYERTVEERWRRLEEQRQREELRRAAVEEKRRQQLEEERERLEALMKRSLERSLQLEQRTKRWGRGCPTGAGDCENTPLSFSAASALSHGIASPLPAVSESAPCSPHRSPLCGSLNPADHSRAALQGGSQSTPNTPKKERLRRDRRTASPGCGFPVRRSESPAGVTKLLASPTTSRLVSKTRAQSPSNAHQYHHSPSRHRSTKTSVDHRAEDKTETAVKKNPDIPSGNPSTKAEHNEIHKTRSSKGERRLKGDTPQRHLSPDRIDHMPPKVDPSEKSKDSAPCVATGKVAAGTTNAEEATRLLAERRRQARAQKQLEEKKQEHVEDERPKEEQMRRHLEQQREVKEVSKKEAEPHRLKQDEEKPQQRIEEIMKRTRKGDADLKKEAQVETKSPPGEVKTETNVQANEQAIKTAEFKEQGDLTLLVKREAAAQMDNEKNVHIEGREMTPTHSVPDKRPQEAGVLLSQPQEREKEGNVNKQHRVDLKEQMNQESMTAVAVKVNQREGGVMNGAVKEGGGGVSAEVSKQHSPHVWSTEATAKGGSQTVKPPVMFLPVRHSSPPIIKLQPLDVKGSCDEAQSMEVRREFPDQSLLYYYYYYYYYDDYY